MSENKLTGDWSRALSKLDSLGKDVIDAAKLATHQNALMLEATIVKHFENQDLGWADLDPAYKKYKAAKGLSNQTLIATATLMNSITTQVLNDGLSAFVGVLRLGKRKDGNPPVVIAAVHEFGSPARGIKARPYLRPSLKEKLSTIEQRYKEKIGEVLKEAAK